MLSLIIHTYTQPKPIGNWFACVCAKRAFVVASSEGECASKELPLIFGCRLFFSPFRQQCLEFSAFFFSSRSIPSAIHAEETRASNCVQFLFTFGCCCCCSSNIFASFMYLYTCYSFNKSNKFEAQNSHSIKDYRCDFQFL